MRGQDGGRVPRVDPALGRRLFRAVHAAISRGLVRALPRPRAREAWRSPWPRWPWPAASGAAVSLADVPRDGGRGARRRPALLRIAHAVPARSPPGDVAELTDSSPDCRSAGSEGGRRRHGCLAFRPIDRPGTRRLDRDRPAGRRLESRLATPAPLVSGPDRMPSGGEVCSMRSTKDFLPEKDKAMLRFVTFVDGSNLDGVLKHLNLRVDDYGSFYRHVFEQSVHYWGRTFAEGSPWPTAQHSRIYWYVVGKMDEWDLNDPKAEARLRSRFELNPRLRDSYLEDVVPADCPTCPPTAAPTRRGTSASRETREWYEGKRRALDRKKRFYHGVQAATDFVEIRQEGHWKVDLLHHTLNEKGLDTSLAVDMVALQDTYDIALLISGDADGIPGINYVKGRSKHVGVAEFRRGAPADFPTKGASSRLKIAAASQKSSSVLASTEPARVLSGTYAGAHHGIVRSRGQSLGDLAAELVGHAKQHIGHGTSVVQR